MNLKEFKNNDTIAQETMKVMITVIKEEEAKNGNKYTTLTLQDSSEELSCKHWSSELIEGNVPAGAIINATIKKQEFNGTDSYILVNATVLEGEDPANYRNDFTPSEKTLMKYFNDVLKSLSTPYKNIIKELFNSMKEIFGVDALKNFKIWPAAINMHHNGQNGLLYHTVGVLRHAKALIQSTEENYDIKLNHDLIYTSIIIHDFFKLKEYDANEVGKGEGTKYSIIGHIDMIVGFVASLFYQKKIDEEMYLQLTHCVAAHHGKEEWGSPVKPSIPEAYIIHMADLFDSRMYGFKAEIRKLDEGKITPKRIMGLDGAYVYNPIDLNKNEAK